MTSYEHTFCRILLKDTMEEVRKHYTKEQTKSAWVWKAGRDDFEFHFRRPLRLGVSLLSAY